jgi:hypothetical protein
MRIGDETGTGTFPVTADRGPATPPASGALTVFVALTFLGVAIVQTWPLALHFSTSVTGNPGGDTGAYLWNIWHFRHRVLELGQSPFLTSSILAAGGPANLALHNYTVFADLLALPLQSIASVVTSFNAVYVINVTLCGLGMFLLAHRVTDRIAESWLAGLMFAWAPFLVARGGSHFSLAAAAPLPFFLYWLDRAWTGGRTRDAAAAGAAVAWAFYCDPYYAVYCALLGAMFVASHFVVLTRAKVTSGTRTATRVIDAMIALILAASLVVHFAAGGATAIGGLTIAIRTLYTPMLVVAVLLAVRLVVRSRISLLRPAVPPRAVGLAVTLAVTAAVLLGPELHALALMTASEELARVPVLWRSSAPGVDAIAFLIPNPNHVLAPTSARAWLAGQPGGFDENVASLSYVAVLVLAVAWRYARFRASGLWLTVTIGFASLAIGPFLRVGGARTFFPGPWALVRYLPIVGEARMPQRFSVLVFLGLTVLFAAALVAIGQRWPDRRRAIVAAVGVALALELWPAPRQLWSAEVPGVFRVVAQDTRRLRVLELPFGVRDGLSSLGDFSASSQFYQTLHTHDVVGGYLSRVSDVTKRAYLEEPLTRTLMDFAEGRTPLPDQLAVASASAPGFIDRAALGYVVIDRVRVSPAEREFATSALGLTRVDASMETGPRELYVTRLGRE